MAKLEAIWLKRMKGGPMDSVETATLKTAKGLVGNANQGGKRQVTILSRAVWEDRTNQLGVEADPRSRRANLLINGELDLADSRGKILSIGGHRIRIYGETKPCEQMDAVAPGLQEMLRDKWGGGAFGEVLDDGPISVGDTVQWIEE